MRYKIHPFERPTPNTMNESEQKIDASLSCRVGTNRWAPTMEGSASQRGAAYTAANSKSSSEENDRRNAIYNGEVTVANVALAECQTHGLTTKK